MPASFTNLLSQTTSSSTTASETLADTITKHAKSLSDADLAVLVAGLREQSARWNAAQAQGSKERITSKKITTKRPKKNAAVALGTGFTIKTPTL